MQQLEKEYTFFKTICQYRSLANTAQNLLFTRKLQNKGLELIVDKDVILLQPDIQALCKATILSSLSNDIFRLIDELEVVYETASTNMTIQSKLATEHFSILLAEYQSGGQGRRNKKWSSPLGANIYLSIRFLLPHSHIAHFIPLITALAVCQALSELGIDDCQVKWPNDIYLDDKKLAGILVESRFDAQKNHHITVGIGLNVNMKVNPEIDKQWTSLFNSRKTSFDRNKVVSTLLTATMGNYNLLSVFDFDQLHQEWSKRDYLLGKTIHITDEKGEYTARALGLAEDGALVVEKNDRNGKIQKRIYSAEVSVMPVLSSNSDK